MSKSTTKRPVPKKTTKRKTAAAKRPRPTKKQVASALNTLAADQVAPFKERTELLYGAVQESIEIMGERLREGELSTREIANTFLVCVSNRFDKFTKPDFHEGLGYDHKAAEIASNLRRIEQNLSRRTLQPDHGRIDTVLGDLVDEVMRLAQSQSVFCEHCEHCLRERYIHGFDAIIVGQGYTTEATLDDKTWAHIVERFSWPDELSKDEIIVALRHIESLAWVERPGAVKEAVTQLVTALVKQSINLDELREGFEEASLANVKLDIHNNETTD